MIPLGVDAEVYERATRVGGGKWHKQEDEFWVAYIGTVGKTYDIDTVLRAAHLLIGSLSLITFSVFHL